MSSLVRDLPINFILRLERMHHVESVFNFDVSNPPGDYKNMKFLKLIKFSTMLRFKFESIECH